MVLKASKGKKTILFWNKYWHWTHFHMGAGNRGFVNCPYSNCYTTTRRSKLWNKDETIHAVIFHGVRLNLTQIEKLKRIRAQHVCEKAEWGEQDPHGRSHL